MRVIEVKHKFTKKINLYRSIKIALDDLGETKLSNKVYYSLSRKKEPFENEQYLITRKIIK